MDIPAEFRDSVGFLAYKDNDEWKTIGTCFFLTKPLEKTNDDERKWVYFAITARHLIEKTKLKAKNGKVYFRLNDRHGGVRYVESDTADWKTHSTKNVDAAVLPLDFDSSDFANCYAWNIHRMQLTEEFIRKKNVGPGDDLFFPGLFVHHMGEKRNIPIVRTGTIAAMPGEAINTDTQGSFRAYLVEARSIGGLSGSPVFLHLSGRKSLISGGAWNSLQLLGMVQGHYGVRDILDNAEDDNFLLDRRSRSINLGIAIVVPIEDIVDMFDLPEIAEVSLPLSREVTPHA